MVDRQKPSVVSPSELIECKQALGIHRLALQIHNASFPSNPEEDLGRGTPYSDGALRFYEFAARLGFDAIQLGPRGMTDRGNPSPYDATIFSRNPLDLPLKRFVAEGRLSQRWNSLQSSLPAAVRDVVPYPAVHDAFQRAIPEIVASASPADRAAAQGFLEANRAWLVPDALFDVLSREHGTSAWETWHRTDQGAVDQRLFHPAAGQEGIAASRLNELQERFPSPIADYALIQWLLDQEAKRLLVKTADLGLTLYGDLQVGLSQRDLWAWQKLFLADYRLGAPPSRTTASGQPWGYAVLDPALVGTASHPGPALLFVRQRIQRLLSESAGVRIDHPHGWIDPWVYHTADPDPFHAVQHGARLFSSPADPRHPELARLAIPRIDQIDPTQSLHADGHVRHLDDEQVARYSVLVDEVLRQLPRTDGAAGAVACEVLSTLPYPVSRVMQRHGLGRFRVVQKLNLQDPADVYRIENAEPQDWIMLGTHDTAPIWQLADQWCQGEAGAAWAKYLNQLPGPAVSSDVATASGPLVNACFARMLASRARHVAVFFPDLFGLRDRYNEPGLVSDANWSLRLPDNFEELYARQSAFGAALDLPACLAAASSRASH